MDAREEFDPALPLNFRRVADTHVYRSSRLDGQAARALKALGVRGLLDLRIENEILPEDGSSPRLEDHYALRSATSLLASDGSKSQEPGCHGDQRAACCCVKTPLVDVKALVGCCPWYVRLAVGVALMMDRLLGTRLGVWVVVVMVISRPGDDCMLHLYIHLLEHSRKGIRHVLSLLSQPQFVPAVVFCSLGKDRTGVISALVGAVCGQTPDDIVADYAFTQKFVKLTQNSILLRGFSWFRPHPATRDARSDTMRQLLKYVETRYGSFAGYLESIGFGSDDQERLRRNLTSPLSSR